MINKKDIINNLFDYCKKFGNIISNLEKKARNEDNLEVSERIVKIVNENIELYPDFHEDFANEDSIEVLYALKETDPQEFNVKIIKETLFLNLFMRSINKDGNVIISLDDFYKSLIINVKFN